MRVLYTVLGGLVMIGLAGFFWAQLFFSAEVPARIALGVAAWIVLSLPLALVVGRAITLQRDREVRQIRSGRSRSREAA